MNLHDYKHLHMTWDDYGKAINEIKTSRKVKSKVSRKVKSNIKVSKNLPSQSARRKV